MKQILGDYIRLEDTMFSIETQNNSIMFWLYPNKQTLKLR